MADESQKSGKKKNARVGWMVILGFAASFFFLFAVFMVSGRTASEIVHEAEFRLFRLVICALVAFCVFVVWLERKLNPPPKAGPPRRRKTRSRKARICEICQKVCQKEYVNGAL